MHVTLNHGEPKIRHVTALVSSGMGDDYNVHSNDICNLERALVERVYLVKGKNGFERPPAPLKGTFAKRLLSFRAMMQTNVVYPSVLTHEQFVLSYTGRKRHIYERAVESLLVSRWTPKDSHIKAFVKVEKHNLTQKDDPAPRIIQPRDPRYNVSVGIYIKAIEGLIYKCIDECFGHRTVMKEMTVTELGTLMKEKWDMFDKPIAIGLDASRFDQHVSQEALRWEHNIYQSYFPWSNELRTLLRLQLNNYGSGRTPNGSVKYKTIGCRMSGDMNTGLGNTLLMCAMVHSYCSSKRIKFQLANNGDDCVLFIERHDLQCLVDLPEWFNEMGFTMKVEPPVNILEKVEFCQMQPVNTGYGWIMVRKPSCALGKDLITYNGIQTKGDWTYYRQAISDCGFSLYGHLPVYSAFYKMLDAGRVKDWRKNPNLTGGLFWWGSPINREVDEAIVRHSFYLAFDIYPEHQISLEGYYNAIKPYWPTDGSDINYVNLSDIHDITIKQIIKCN